jgi:chromosome segregation ATPase
MYLKALCFKDDDIAFKILQSKTSKEAKDLGRQIKNFDNNIWIKERENAMYIACLEKFKQNLEQKTNQLDATVQALEDQKQELIRQGVKLNGEIAAREARLKQADNKILELEDKLSKSKSEEDFKNISFELEKANSDKLQYLEDIKRLENEKKNIVNDYKLKQVTDKEQAERELSAMLQKKLELEGRLTQAEEKLKNCSNKEDFDKLKIDYNALDQKYKFLGMQEKTTQHNLETANRNIENGRLAALKYKEETEVKIRDLTNNLKK